MRAILLIPFVFILASCGESFVDITARHQTDYDTLKSDLAAIAGKIPKPFVAVSLDAPLDPLPNFDPYSTDSNTLCMRVGQLADPTEAVAWRDTLDLGNNWMEDLEEALSSDGKPSDGGSKIKSNFEEFLKAAVNCRYVIVYETLSYQVASVVDKKTFDPGKAELAVYLFDRKADRIVYSFLTSATPNTIVHVTSEKNNAIETGLQAKLYGSIVENARATIYKTLSNETGALIKKL